MIDKNVPKGHISILLVDDHSFIREYLGKLVATYNFTGKLKLASSGEESIEMLNQEHFDIILMDNSMPKGISGIEATYYLTKHLPSLKVIGMTNLDIGNTGIRFYFNGAKGFFEKGMAIEHLENAILNVYNGGTYFTEEVNEIIHKKDFTPYCHKTIELSERDYKIIEYLSVAKTAKQIAVELNLKVRRVEQLIKEIHRKTGCETPFQLALFLTRNKYLK